jgi:hypothetical protein
MSAWTPPIRWFSVRLILVLVALLTPGCGYNAYTIPPAELQRLAQIPPARRGNHVRAYTSGLVPVPTPVVVTPPGPPPAIVPPGAPAALPVPPVRDAAVNGELVGDLVPPDEVAMPATEPTDSAVVVSVDVVPPRFVPSPAPPVRPRLAPTRMPPPAVAIPRAPPMAAGHVTPPRLPSSAPHASTPSIHVASGHSGASHTSHSSGGGGGGAVVGAVVVAVAVIGLIAILAEANVKDPFDGWVQTLPEHPVTISYRSGQRREVRLGDLKPTDIVGMQYAVMYDSAGAIERLEPAGGGPLPAQPTQQAPPPARPPVPKPATDQPRPPPAVPSPTPTTATYSDLFS